MFAISRQAQLRQGLAAVRVCEAGASNAGAFTVDASNADAFMAGAFMQAAVKNDKIEI